MPKITFQYAAIVLICLSVFPLTLSADVVNLTVCIQDAMHPCPVAPSPSPSPSTNPTSGGGGGGGGGYSPSLSSEIIFRGIAYPLSNVHLLADGQTRAVTQAGPDAHFEIDVSGLSTGTYTFSIWAEDASHAHSVNESFTIYVNSAVTTIISGILVPPTVSVDKQEVLRGDVLTLFGQSQPQVLVGLSIHSLSVLRATTTADATGSWLYKLNTSALDFGSHTAEAFSMTATDTTETSNPVSFTVGDKNVPSQPAPSVLKGDLNGDGKVNLIDFSIAAYWYGRPLSSRLIQLERERLGGRGMIDLVDFSIIAYYWTG